MYQHRESIHHFVLDTGGGSFLREDLSLSLWQVAVLKLYHQMTWRRRKSSVWAAGVLSSVCAVSSISLAESLNCSSATLSPQHLKVIVLYSALSCGIQCQPQSLRSVTFGLRSHLQLLCIWANCSIPRGSLQSGREQMGTYSLKEGREDKTTT